jgi:hypothetical protein
MAVTESWLLHEVEHIIDLPWGHYYYRIVPNKKI